MKCENSTEWLRYIYIFQQILFNSNSFSALMKNHSFCSENSYAHFGGEWNVIVGRIRMLNENHMSDKSNCA